MSNFKAATALLSVFAGIALSSPANAAQTIEYTEQDLQLDTAIAIVFADAGGQSEPYYFTSNGSGMQMVMCKATFGAHLSDILAALRSHPDFKGRTPTGAGCVRTNQTILNPRPE